MKNMLFVARRELKAYFVSPMAYVVSAIYLAVMGGFFGFVLYYSQEATLRYVFLNAIPLLFLVLVAQILTMRLLADEQRQGTLELLLTSPVRDWEVVLGKYLAALGAFGAMLALTVYFPVTLLRVGNPDVGIMLASYLGYILLGASLLAIGLFASSLTQNQIVAAVIGIGISLILWLSGAVADLVGASIGGIFTYLPIFDHFMDFVRGIIDTKDIIYYLSLIGFFLFLAVRVVESRRWK
jgi:ABC-2 type transport system permease protein